MIPISSGIKFKLLTKNKQFVMLSFLNISPTSLFIPFFLLIILQTHWPFLLPKTCQVLSYSKKFSLAFLEYCLYGCFSSFGYHGSFPNKPSKSILTIEYPNTLSNGSRAQVHLFMCYLFSPLVHWKHYNSRCIMMPGAPQIALELYD